MTLSDNASDETDWNVKRAKEEPLWSHVVMSLRTNYMMKTKK